LCSSPEETRMPTARKTAPNPSAPRKSDPAVVRAAVVQIARLLSDDKCDDVIILDVAGMSQMADVLVIGSGTSDRQLRSAADDAERLADELGFPVLRRSTDDRTTWILLDAFDIVVHIFEPNTRAYYDLEMLWGDAKQIDWQHNREAPSRDRAGVRRS